MTSKTSCFEPALLRRTVCRVVPLVILFTLIWLLAVPLPLFDYARSNDLAGVNRDVSHQILTIGHVGGTLSSFSYGLACAWMVFFYLFSGKNTNFHAALPIRRETMFCTYYIAGLLFYLVPMLLITLITWLVTIALGVPMLNVCAMMLVENILTFLFFYSFAVLCCMVVGNAILMPLVYIILNFAIPAMEIILRTLLQAFVYGVPEIYGIATGIFAPVFYLLNTGGASCIYASDLSTILGVTLDNWSYYAAIAVVGLVFAVVALLFYRKREMERSGDAIAVRWLRPVFLYVFTLGCALGLGLLIVSIATNNNVQSNFALTLFATLFGTVFGYVVAQMLLQKTLRVLKNSWRGLAVSCAVIVLFLGSLRLDFGGYVSRIPKQENVASVSLEAGSPITDADVIAETIALHQRFLDERRTLASAYEDLGWSRSLDICYNLKNGKSLRRTYRVPFPYDDSSVYADGSIVSDVTDLLTAPPVILSLTTPDYPVAEANISSCEFSGPYAETPYEDWGYTSTMLSTREAYRLYTDGILPDLAATAFGAQSALDQTGFSQAANSFEADTEDPAALQLEESTITFVFVDSKGANSYFYYSLTADAVNTVACLRDLGYLPE